MTLCTGAASSILASQPADPAPYPRDDTRGWDRVISEREFD